MAAAISWTTSSSTFGSTLTLTPTHMAKKGKLPPAVRARSAKVRFQRTKFSSWEDGVQYFDGDRPLCISTTKGETLLCPPYKTK